MKNISRAATIPFLLNSLFPLIFFTFFFYLVVIQLRETSDLITNQTVLYIVSGEALVFMFIAILGVSAICYYLLAVSWKYNLGDTELKSEYGVLSKKYSSIDYSRVQNVDIKRSLIERVMGQSTIAVQTSGSTNHEVTIPGLSFNEAESLRAEIMKKSKENG